MEDKEIILRALIEFENEHWNSEDQVWQKQINALIDKYS